MYHACEMPAISSFCLLHFADMIFFLKSHATNNYDCRPADVWPGQHVAGRGPRDQQAGFAHSAVLGDSAVAEFRTHRVRLWLAFCLFASVCFFEQSCDFSCDFSTCIMYCFSQTLTVLLFLVFRYPQRFFTCILFFCPSRLSLHFLSLLPSDGCRTPTHCTH
jgi:hypothetical protein